MKLTGVTSALFVGAAFASSRLEVIELPEGFQPEGIVFADGWTAYVSSIGSEYGLNPSTAGTSAGVDSIPWNIEGAPPRWSYFQWSWVGISFPRYAKWNSATDLHGC